MTNRHIRHLPVTEEGKLVGMISIGDVVRFVIEEQRAIIEDLEQYITGHHQ
jgi:CBS domain-containing protein